MNVEWKQIADWSIFKWIFIDPRSDGRRRNMSLFRCSYVDFTFEFNQIVWSLSLCRQHFESKKGRVLVENWDDPVIHLWLYVFVCNVGIQCTKCIYWSSNGSLSTLIMKEVNSDVWLSNTSFGINVDKDSLEIPYTCIYWIPKLHNKTIHTKIYFLDHLDVLLSLSPAVSTLSW